MLSFSSASSYGRCSLGVTFLLVSSVSVSWAQLPFFPGAEGYGGSFSGTAPAAGWFSNATVYRVTNLNDSGAGSLRGAFQENSTNKIIIFDVAGTINLTSDNLDIKNLSNYYIAGQTAPGPVTVYGDMVQLTHSGGKENRNVILRYMSFRKGTGDNSDSITFAGSGLGTNMILDHVSASWSEDEILSVANNNTNVTVQYSTIHDALVSNHAYGSLIRPRISSQVTFHHNLYAHNASRQARFGTYNGETLTADFRNNVVYNFRDRASYTGGSSESDQEKSDINYVGNYIVAGPGTQGNPNVAFSVDKNVDTRVYQSGNFIDPDKDAVLDGSNTGMAMFVINNQTDQTLEFMGSPFATPPVATQTATDAYHQIVDYVGNWWWARDAIDSRVIGNVTNFTGVPLGAAAPNASELNGLLAAPMTSHPVGYDADNDGMADAWETLHGGNLVWNADFDNDGYINLIEFINEKGEFPAPAPIVFNGGFNNRYAHIMNWKTDDGGITAGSNWQPSKYDLAVIETGSVVVDAVGQHAGMLLVAPNAGNNATLSINSGWLNAAERVEVGSAMGEGTLVMGASGTLFAPMVSVGAMGELSGSGEIIGNVLNEGLVSPGASPGTMDLSGNFVQNAGGTLKMEIASTSSFDKLIIGGTLMAGGTLDIDLLSFTPEAGNSFDLFDFSNSIGAFVLDLPGLTSGLAWDDSNLLTSGVLSVVASVVENADFDEDGEVDGRDFLIWQRGFGSAGSLATGDANNDGSVDAIDLGIWQNQYGTSVALASAHAVPEPVGLTLLLCALGAFFQLRSDRSC
ncbi:dockerin type I domain-containing protein [Bythopirellula goksoeyrii]|uniref:Probable pectate lyase C n=1 Tax=Bythopirellula goksoeyrii TaxID=1400387 RepID=A0A5B9QQP2_9BACT|nr:dockerin type I domain-containing protein [Bythopirellula goksoeyrii]QEG36441.1 hypothetical protein Pr1d_37550 [Bythopirellula goksoeyrii]